MLGVIEDAKHAVSGELFVLRSADVVATDLHIPDILDPIHNKLQKSQSANNICRGISKQTTDRARSGFRLDTG